MAAPERIVISDDDDDNEPAIHIPSTPVAPARPVKRPRKAPLKEEDEEERTSPQDIGSVRFFILALLFCAFLVGLGYGISVILRTRAEHQGAGGPTGVFPLFQGSFKNTRSEFALYNTTTPDIVWQVRKSLQSHQYAYGGRFPCLCMHHVVFNTSYTQVRLCNIYNAEMNQHYFLVNPRIIGALRADLQVPKLELSVSCKEPRDRHVKRHTGVFVEWEDEATRTHYALFRDSIAFCMQLAINEFEGSEGIQCA